MAAVVKIGERLVTYVDVPTAQEVDALAKAEDRPVAYVVRQLIREALDARKAA